jgi:transglutaminase-like putative cysteine protease
LGESGLIYVNARGKRSNGVLFSNIATVPRPIEGEDLGFGPRITSISPQAGVTGTLITITGNNFGVSREGGGVFFSWEHESFGFNPYMIREPEFIEVSETELGYISWNTREIQVRLPDGAVSGNVEVRTIHGSSRPVFFDVSGKPGRKTFSDKRSYAITYSVDIRVLEATRPNTLYLWIPKPALSPSQRNVGLVSRNKEPFVENHRGISLFKLDNLGAGSNHSVNLSYLVDVYAVGTEINPQAIRQQTTPLSAMYTQGSSRFPIDNPRIRTTVNSVIGREQNPYIRARLLYEWVISNIYMVEALPASSSNIAAVLELRRADPYMTALLYTTLLRAAGIPCLPVAGVLIDRNGQTLIHYWTEFWINDFGWIPADPAAGTGAIHESFITRENPASFYFGNMDNHRIAFSRGELVLSQMESRGRLVSRTNSFSLQNIWEEASGGLESYNSFWGDIIISGIYIQ